MKLTPVTTRRSSPHVPADVRLSAPNEALLRLALLSNAGEPVWRVRKEGEVRELVGLQQIAPDRFKILQFDLVDGLRCLFALRTPVPLRPDAHDRLGFASEAVLGLDYRRQAMTEAMPGTAFLCILKPRDVWLGNVSPNPQMLCLGPKIAAGTRCRNLVLMAYAALAGQTMQEVDPRSGAGVMNLEAALWWQRNLARLPLSNEPFLPVPSEPERSPS